MVETKRGCAGESVAVALPPSRMYGRAQGIVVSLPPESGRGGLRFTVWDVWIRQSSSRSRRCAIDPQIYSGGHHWRLNWWGLKGFCGTAAGLSAVLDLPLITGDEVPYCPALSQPFANPLAGQCSALFPA